MIITRTPLRVSFFGGGTDYPAWYRRHGGAVLAAGYALLAGRRWGRGLAVFAELLLLPVAYYLSVGSHRAPIGIPVGVLALAVLALLFSPAAIRWAAGES